MADPKQEHYRNWLETNPNDPNWTKVLDLYTAQYGAPDAPKAPDGFVANMAKGAFQVPLGIARGVGDTAEMVGQLAGYGKEIKPFSQYVDQYYNKMKPEGNYPDVGRMIGASAGPSKAINAMGKIPQIADLLTKLKQAEGGMAGLGRVAKDAAEGATYAMAQPVSNVEEPLLPQKAGQAAWGGALGAIPRAVIGTGEFVAKHARAPWDIMVSGKTNVENLARDFYKDHIGKDRIAEVQKALRGAREEMPGRMQTAAEALYGTPTHTVLKSIEDTTARFPANSPKMTERLVKNQEAATSFKDNLQTDYGQLREGALGHADETNFSIRPLLEAQAEAKAIVAADVALRATKKGKALSSLEIAHRNELQATGEAVTAQMKALASEGKYPTEALTVTGKIKALLGSGEISDLERRTLKELTTSLDKRTEPTGLLSAEGLAAIKTEISGKIGNISASSSIGKAERDTIVHLTELGSKIDEMMDRAIGAKEWTRANDVYASGQDLLTRTAAKEVGTTLQPTATGTVAAEAGIPSIGMVDVAATLADRALKASGKYRTTPGMRKEIMDRQLDPTQLAALLDEPPPSAYNDIAALLQRIAPPVAGLYGGHQK